MRISQLCPSLVYNDAMLDTLKIPSIAEAERLLAEAADANPGPWVMHSRYVA